VSGMSAMPQIRRAAVYLLIILFVVKLMARRNRSTGPSSFFMPKLDIKL
jgi:hypothetical protein